MDKKEAIRVTEETKKIITEFETKLKKLEEKNSVFVNLDVSNYEYNALEYGGFIKKKVHKLEFSIELDA